MQYLQKLDGIETRFEELTRLMADPETLSDPDSYRKTAKQQSEIEELVAYGSQHEYPEIDEFSIIFKFRSGFHCTFASSSDASWHFPFERIEVFCHHRTIMTEEMERLFDSRGMDPNFETVSFHMFEKEEKWGYVQEDRAFVDAILEDKPPPVTADDGFKSVQLVESVYEAIRSGRQVAFDG